MPLHGIALVWEQTRTHQLTGVATFLYAVSWRESRARRISSKSRTVLRSRIRARTRQATCERAARLGLRACGLPGGRSCERVLHTSTAQFAGRKQSLCPPPHLAGCMMDSFVFLSGLSRNTARHAMGAPAASFSSGSSIPSWVASCRSESSMIGYGNSPAVCVYGCV